MPDDVAHADVTALLADSVLDALKGPSERVAKLSMMLGYTETLLTAKASMWPSAQELKDVAADGISALDPLQASLKAAVALAAPSGPRAALKSIIGGLTGCLSASMPQDAKHRQHMWSIVDWQRAGAKRKALRLDCAGLTLASLYFAHQLADTWPGLADVRFVVAEDHCWLSLDGSAEREGMAEVAAMSPDMQGEAPAPEVWRTWLYAGGEATVCSRAQLLAALIVSMDTCIGEKQSNESWPARDLQRHLLQTLYDACPEALYANATCTLADLQQDVIFDAAREAISNGSDSEAVQAKLKDAAAPLHLMLRVVGACSAHVDSSYVDDAGKPHVVPLFDVPCAVVVKDGTRWWYPFWFTATYLIDTAEVLVEDFSEQLGAPSAAENAHMMCLLALCVLAGGPLSRYRYAKYDGQLHKTLSHLMEQLVGYFQWQQDHPAKHESHAPHAYVLFLRFVDHLAAYFGPVGMPSHIAASVLSVAKKHEPEVRFSCAQEVDWRAPNLRNTAALWRDAKPALRVALEARSAAEVAADANAESAPSRKRARR